MGFGLTPATVMPFWRVVSRLRGIVRCACSVSWSGTMRTGSKSPGVEADPRYQAPSRTAWSEEEPFSRGGGGATWR